MRREGKEGGPTVNRLVDAVAFALAVGDAAQTRAR